MRVVALYRSESDYARGVLDFLRDVRHQTGYEVEELSPDTREGAMMARTYDVVEYPTLLALNNEGAVQAMWRGTLPTISEVGYYAGLE